MRHDNPLWSNPVYQARIAEEETKLRWLITRQPRSRELAYYLIFLLTANERYASAIEACRRVLDTYPGDVIAHMDCPAAPPLFARVRSLTASFRGCLSLRVNFLA